MKLGGMYNCGSKIRIYVGENEDSTKMLRPCFVDMNRVVPVNLDGYSFEKLCDILHVIDIDELTNCVDFDIVDYEKLYQPVYLGNVPEKIWEKINANVIYMMSLPLKE